MWNVSHMNMPIITIYEHFEHAIMLVSFLYLELVHSVLFRIKL